MGTLCQPGKALFSMGQVTFMQFLNVLYRKGLQNLFPQTCIALNFLSQFLLQQLKQSVYLQQTVIGKKSAYVLRCLRTVYCLL